MTLSVPTYDECKSTVIAAIQAGLQITVGGVVVQPTFADGSVFLTFSEVLSLVLDLFYGQLLAADAALRLPSATGADLDTLVALLGQVRKGGGFALVPVKFTRLTSAPTVVTIPAEARVLALDSAGLPSLEFSTLQGAGLDAGVAGEIAAGASAGWAWAQATEAGAAGNIAAGQIALLGEAISGVDVVSNPQVPQPSAPTVVSNAGSGTTTQYRLVASGVSGQTTPSPLGSVSGGSSPNNTLTWPAVQDAAGIDVLVNTGSVGVPVWKLVQQVAGDATTLTDTGQGRAAVYALPATNSTNAGTGGSDAEDDEALRARAPTALAVAGRATEVAIDDAVLAVVGVSRVFLQDAGENGQAAGTAQVYVLGQGPTLSGTAQGQIGAAIAATKAAGVQVSWSQVVPQAVAVTYVAHSDGTVSPPSALAGPIASALAGYLAGLELGAGVPLSGIITAIARVVGVASVAGIVMVTSVAGTPTTYTMQDVPGQAGILYTLGTITSTIT